MTASASRMDCDEVVRRLWPHLDGALPDAERQQVIEHLEGCTECRSHFDFARAFLVAVARARPGVADDTALRARVFAALLREGFSE